jgi:uncharacterized RDD family membrane protein YckC
VAASVIDLIVVLALGGGVLLAVAAARFVWSPLHFQWSAPPWPVTLAVCGLIAAGYLTIAWATTGRTCGGAVLGLRVLSASHVRLGWARAALRAALCILFPPGLLWAGITRRRRSLQDAVLLSVVVYDWSDDAGLAATAARRQPALGVAQVSATEPPEERT